MRKLLMFVGSALALSFYLNCSVSLASNNIQKNENDMDITSPKHLISKENKIEFDDEEMNKSFENKKIEESKKIEPDCTVHTRQIGGMDQAIYETVETHQDKGGKAFKHSYTYLGTGLFLYEKTDDAVLLKKLFHKDCINCVKRKGAES